MTQVSEIRNAAIELDTADRAELAVFLLGSLEGAHHWVDDEEAMNRRDELDSGAVEGISREEFNRQCGHENG
jgi:hypothetical protein